jgi:hypothetical protein
MSTIELQGGVRVPEQAAPGTPATGTVLMYAKSDGNLYQKDDAGTETVLAGGGSFPLLAPNGSVTNPSYAFTNDIDAGMFLNAVGDLRLAVGGHAGVRITDDGTNKDVILDSRGTGQVAFFDDGVSQVLVSATQITVVPPIRGPNGSNTAPTYSFSSDSGNGMYLSGTDTLGFTTNGVLRLSLNTVNVIATLAHLGPDGTNTAPAYSFTSDSGNGMYLSGTDTLGFATNGTLRLSVSTTTLTSTLVMNGGNGLASAPMYSFTSDVDTGLYLNAVGDVRLVAAGSTAGIPAQLVVTDTGTNGSISLFSRGTGAMSFWHNFVNEVTIDGSGMNVVDGITIASDHDVQVFDWMTVSP